MCGLRFLLSLAVFSSYLLIGVMSDVQTLEDHDTDDQNISESSLFVSARYSCGTKQALPCIEKLTGKHNHAISIKYVLYILK